MIHDGSWRRFRPTEQVIQVSPESLLLEGMRRFDEAAR